MMYLEALSYTRTHVTFNVWVLPTTLIRDITVPDRVSIHAGQDHGESELNTAT